MNILICFYSLLDADRHFVSLFSGLCGIASALLCLYVCMCVCVFVPLSLCECMLGVAEGGVCFYVLYVYVFVCFVRFMTAVVFCAVV